MQWPRPFALRWLSNDTRPDRGNARPARQRQRLEGWWSSANSLCSSPGAQLLCCGLKMRPDSGARRGTPPRTRAGSPAGPSQAPGVSSWGGLTSSDSRRASQSLEWHRMGRRRREQMEPAAMNNDWVRLNTAEGESKLFRYSNRLYWSILTSFSCSGDIQPLYANLKTIYR